MSRVEEERFTGKEVERIYIAGRLPEARRVEEVLTRNGVDYFVEIEAFRTYVLGLFASAHSGVAFYVLTEHSQVAQRILRDVGLKAGLPDEGEMT